MKNISVSEKNGVLSVRLNRPEFRNAFSVEMIEELTKAFQKPAQDNSIRALRLEGEGKVFCAGADLSYMKEMAKFSFEKNQEDAHVLRSMFESLASCAVPVITKVHGAAFGGGLGLIAASDIVIAEEKTQYCFSEVKLGLVPAVISEFVARKSALGVVTPWMLTGQIFTTNDAIRMGLVHFGSDMDGIEDQTNEIIHSLLEAGPQAVRETKKLLRQISVLSPDQLKTETTKVISERRVSPEGQEGLAAFFEKRNPSWRHS